MFSFEILVDRYITLNCADYYNETKTLYVSVLHLHVEVMRIVYLKLTSVSVLVSFI